MTATTSKALREAWLRRGVEMFTRAWQAAGIAVPADVQVSCSFPGGGSPRARIGECWPRARSAAKVNEIFINPTLDSSLEVLDVLGHELLHAVDDCKSKHGSTFTKNSKRVGYSGGKHSAAKTDAAKALLASMHAALGDYPHGRIALSVKPVKPNAGLHKFSCKLGCGDVLYSTSRNVELFGAPSCRECGEPMVAMNRQDQRRQVKV